MACAAALAECCLMVMGFLGLIGDIAVAGQANLDRVRLGKSGLPAGMWTMTVGAVARRPWVLNLGGFD